MLIELKDVCYTYGVGTVYEVNALDHVNLSIDEGEFIGVIGHTGSGKSTLIQHLNGLIKPTSGEVLRISGTMATICGRFARTSDSCSSIPRTSSLRRMS